MNNEVAAEATAGAGVFRRARAGYTLMELIVVVTILAALTAMVTPLFRVSFAETSNEFAIRNLVATMKYAQTLAITKAMEHRIYFKPSANTYWLMRKVGRKDGEAVLEPVADQEGDAQVLPVTLEMREIEARRDRERDAYYISFFPSGACDVAEIRIALAKEPHRRFTISTKGALNRFSVRKP